VEHFALTSYEDICKLRDSSCIICAFKGFSDFHLHIFSYFGLDIICAFLGGCSISSSCSPYFMYFIQLATEQDLLLYSLASAQPDNKNITQENLFCMLYA